MEGIYIDATIGTFTNYGDIVIGSGNQAFTFKTDGYIEHFINYGNIANSGYMSFWGGGKGISNLTNYGTMGAISYSGSEVMTLNNFGIITKREGDNIKGNKVLIQNYLLMIGESADKFNNNDIYSLSRLVVNGDVKFKDSDSKIILDFGSGFEYGAGYKIGNLTTALPVDFSRLTTRSDIYYLTQNGDNFIVNLAPQYGIIGTLHKSNIRTMNNFYTLSNSMIYPHKYKVGAKRLPKKKRVIRRVKKVSNLFDDSSLQNNSNAILSSLRENERSEFSWQSTDSTDSLESLESNEFFAYKTDSNNMNQTKQQSANHPRISTNRQVKSTIPSTQSINNYHFILTPFLNHNLFFESGRYNLSGLEYGFLTAFSGKLTPSNTLGTHFIMSYGSLRDNDTTKSKGDKDFNIKSFNLNIGLNYKLDLIFDMYIKARGDFYYFLNQVKTLTIFEVIKPNNLGFGLSLSYGKDFDFKDNGILGIEVGLDYKALQSSEVNINNNATNSISETYQKNLYNLIYVDLGLNYSKYFNTNIGLWGINTTLGIKGNITANKLSISKIHINNLNRDVNMVLDNDKILAYANISASYVLNHKDFDMEFSLAYYGNYGDRVISNGGGVEWRVIW